ncbi:hypothetical protein D3C84_893550 [compost metagenome]
MPPDKSRGINSGEISPVKILVTRFDGTQAGLAELQEICLVLWMNCPQATRAFRLRQERQLKSCFMIPPAPAAVGGADFEPFNKLLLTDGATTHIQLVESANDAIR